MHIDKKVLEDVKKVLHGTSTTDGIEMLRLSGNPKWHELNFAGNTYLAALQTIKELMHELGIDDQLYTREE